jgi:Domain of unknown function (DUF5668)
MGSTYYRRHGLVGPVILVGLGAILLLENMGLLSGNLWTVLLRMWPLILIAIGIDLLIGRRSTWGALLSLLLIVALFVGGFWLAGVRVQSGAQLLPTQDVRQPVGSAKAAEVLLSPSAGQLDLKAAPGSADLLRGRVPSEMGSAVSMNVSAAGSLARIELRDSGAVGFPFIVSGDRAAWTLAVTDQVPVDLKVAMGAGEMTLDLSGLDISHLQVDTAVGQTTIRLPSQGRFQGKVSSAIGQIVIEVPSGLGLRLHLSSGIAGVTVPPSYRHEGDDYTSPGYGSAEGMVDLEISQAIGSILIR